MAHYTPDPCRVRASSPNKLNRLKKNARSTLSHPASFSNWIERRSDKLRHDGRPEWQRQPDGSGGARVAVLVHSSVTFFSQSLKSSLSSIPVPFDLIWTSADATENKHVPEGIGPALKQTRILRVAPGIGRWAALLSVVNAGLLEPYDLVLKINEPERSSKTQFHQGESNWSAGLVDRARNALGSFAEDPSIGIVTLEESFVADSEPSQLSHELLRRLELEPEESGLRTHVPVSYWTRAFLLNGLRALELSELDFGTSEEEANAAEEALNRVLGFLCGEAGFRLAAIEQLSAAETNGAWQRYLPETRIAPEARVAPFYLPQFHSFPENDSWWGRGFTEWSNASSAKPMFDGHRQPNLPSDLGFYDLSSNSVRQKQYKLAVDAGIEGFMYYYYWFAGRRLMNLPVEMLVRSEDPHPFCLMWANENWTRRWDGGDENILIAQEHDRIPPENFIDDVREFITDERYMRVGGKPLLAVYRISQLPNFRDVLKTWRERAVAFGLPGLHIISVDVGTHMQGLQGDVLEHGLDGTLEFPPHNREWVFADSSRMNLHHAFSGSIFEYGALVSEAQRVLRLGIEESRYPGVMVNFDNTARRQNDPHLWVGSNPYTFRRWLREAVLGVQDRAEDERLVFINAWNEWAEGAVLEPSQRFGRTYLQAVKSAVYAP